MNSLFVESGLAFLEGVGLIVSPCILPVLPLVLSASVGSGGRRRTYGIIAGFIVAFAAFTWSARWIVSALGISFDVIKYGSLVLLALFGLVLLSDYLSERFSLLTQRFAVIGAGAATETEGGFLSGLGIGALIGLVWTPCAGPILAAVLVQIIRQKMDINGFIILLSFAIGAGLPMLVIALTGREAMNKLGFLKRHTGIIRRVLGVLILVAAGFIASGLNPQELFARSMTEAKPVSGENGLINPVPLSYPAPKLEGSGVWINSEPLTLASLKGKVVLIDFWTYSCINCIRTLPHLTQWDKKYRDDGLVIIGVHAPEFDFEKNADNVRDAVKRYGIKYPVMQDNNLDTWTNFNNRYWPAHYLIDKQGNVVYTHFGEGEYGTTEHNIRYLLGLRGNGVAEKEEEGAFDMNQTPETYLGYARADSFASKEKPKRDVETIYTFPYFLGSDAWALEGPWRIDSEKIFATGKDARLRLNFTSKRVFLVLGTESGTPVEAKVTLNGEPLNSHAGKDAPKGVVKVDGNRLYELVNQKDSQNGLLEITTEGSGLEAYAFTFGR